jgi:hypothetical protein
MRNAKYGKFTAGLLGAWFFACHLHRPGEPVA